MLAKKLEGKELDIRELKMALKGKQEEEVADLEAIKDTNDQLLEAQKEIDVELREELDMALNAVREVRMKIFKNKIYKF